MIDDVIMNAPFNLEARFVRQNCATSIHWKWRWIRLGLRGRITCTGYGSSTW